MDWDFPTRDINVLLPQEHLLPQWRASESIKDKKLSS